MIHRGIATFTLDYGRCPKWLFERMVRLGREMTRVLIDEYGPDEFVRRIADPVWFQSLGTVLAFDWNASGLTTILTAALKEAIRGEERDLGVFICGGKGKTSRKTPEEIQRWGERLALAPAAIDNLAYNSRMAAKVDSALVQDGFQIYHHSFFFSARRGACPHTKRAQNIDRSGKVQNPEAKLTEVKHICDARCGVGAWAVVQQGMNEEDSTARRYHWMSESVNDLVCEPHAAISSETIAENALNMVARESGRSRGLSTELVGQGYLPLMKDITILRKHSSRLSKMVSLKSKGEQLTLLKLEDTEFKYHPVVSEDFSKSRYLDKILAKVTAVRPRTYEELVAMEGVGPKTVRALALVGEIIYGAKPSYEDPARYSFAHGGKDATPYPIDRPTYDKTIAVLQQCVVKMKIAPTEKDAIKKRLAQHQANV